MPPVKRQQWTDVYDRKTGHYKPLEEVDEELTKASNHELSDQVSMKDVEQEYWNVQHAEPKEASPDPETSSTNVEFIIPDGPNNKVRAIIGPNTYRRLSPTQAAVRLRLDIEAKEGQNELSAGPKPGKEEVTQHDLEWSAARPDDKVNQDTMDDFSKESNGLGKVETSEHNQSEPHGLQGARGTQEAEREPSAEVEWGPIRDTGTKTYIPHSSDYSNSNDGGARWRINPDVQNEEGDPWEGHSWQAIRKASGKVNILDVEQYIKKWVKTTHEIVANPFPEGVGRPERCDINTVTGMVLDPVRYPVTLTVEDFVPGVNCCSDDHIERTLRLHGVRGKGDQSRKKNSREIRVPCHLRPAVESDMERVAEIYNEEVRSSYKLPDKFPVVASKFRQLLYGCLMQGLPFFVAVEGWHGHKNCDNYVVGFALVDVVLRGIMGSYSTHGAPCGKITIVVEPEFRRQNICSALLDAVLICCSSRYTARLGYEIVNPDKDPRFLCAASNVREWHHVEMEVPIPSKGPHNNFEDGEDSRWIFDYLAKYFDMDLVHWDEKIYRDDRFGGVWLDRLTFRHQCRDLPT
ncbi:hypothetical protein AAE478_003753 [Parahypoxylon ruwenzoriense]